MLQMATVVVSVTKKEEVTAPAARSLEYQRNSAFQQRWAVQGVGQRVLEVFIALARKELWAAPPRGNFGALYMISASQKFVVKYSEVF